MPIPDPKTLVGKNCSIIFVDSSVAVRKVLAVTEIGVKVDVGGGRTLIYPYVQIKDIRT